MTRAFTRTAVTALLLLVCASAHALGLGPATVASDLSSPLRAEIPLTELIGSGIDPDALVVDVPGFNEHARLGSADPVIPAGLEVSVVRDASGGASLRLSTQHAVREPILRFLLRASWPGGAAVREFTLLLDPPAAARPMHASTSQTAASTPQTAARPRPAATAATRQAALGGNPFQQPAPARAGTRYGPVALGDTLHAILASAYPDSPRDAMAREVLARNPRAFAGGDPNRLLLGATLELPAAATHASIAAASAAGPAPSVSVAVAGVDHLVQPGDTLYAIARGMPGATEAQLASIVQRLFARNPQAFINGDMNRLRAGARLQLERASPTADAPANAPAVTPPVTAAASTASTPGNGTSAAPPVQTPIEAPIEAPVQMPTQVVDELRRDLGEFQRHIAAQVEHQGSLRERMTLLEQEIGSLRDRDAALTQASDALQERLSATATMAVRQPAPQARPGANFVSPAATRPVLAPTPAPVPALTTPVGSAPPAPVPALTTPVGSAPPAPVPAPTTPPGNAPPAPIAALTTPPGSAPSLPAGAMTRALSEPIWLAGGAGVLLLLLLLLLVLRRRRAHVQSIVTEQASPPRHGDEQAARRRLAEVRDAHASRNSHTERAKPAAPAAAESNNVRHTDGAKASALAKEAAVRLAYGDHAAALDSIVEAIRLAPHQDEHKMLLMTVYQSKGRHDKARAIVDELLNRREQLSGDVRAQVELQVQRFGR